MRISFTGDSIAMSNQRSDTQEEHNRHDIYPHCRSNSHYLVSRNGPTIYCRSILRWE